jgi:hypothetical protein
MKEWITFKSVVAGATITGVFLVISTLIKTFGEPVITWLRERRAARKRSGADDVEKGDDDPWVAVAAACKAAKAAAEAVAVAQGDGRNGAQQVALNAFLQASAAIKAALVPPITIPVAGGGPVDAGDGPVASAFGVHSAGVDSAGPSAKIKGRVPSENKIKII